MGKEDFWGKRRGDFSLVFLPLPRGSKGERETFPS